MHAVFRDPPGPATVLSSGQLASALQKRSRTRSFGNIMSIRGHGRHVEHELF
jgi:hypothetical protein